MTLQCSILLSQPQQRSFLKSFLHPKCISNNFTVELCFQWFHTSWHILMYLKTVYIANCDISIHYTWLDDISARLVKYVDTVLTKPITYIVNLSIASGIIHKQLKSTRVKPLFKKNNRTYVGNYKHTVHCICVSNMIDKISI
jgi:hypothetical protein